MNHQNRIIIPYHANAIEHLDWAQGAVSYKKKIKKGRRKRIPSLTGIIRKTQIRAFVFLSLGILLLLLAIPLMLLGAEVSTFHIIVTMYEFGYSFFLFWFVSTMKRAWKKSQSAADCSSGYLIFDDNGIEDTTETGKSVRLLWNDYEMCIIIQNTLVVVMGSIFYFVPAAPETEQAVRSALAKYGREDTFFDCRNKP